MNDYEPAKVVHDGGHARLMARGHWEYIERRRTTQAVVVMAATDDDRLLLVEQYRPAVAANVIEPPAGLVGDIRGEEAEAELEAAKRELLEEVGYRANTWRRLIAGPPEPGLVNQQVVFYEAGDLSREHDGGGDESETILVHAVPRDGLESWLQSKRDAGVLVDPKLYIGLYWMARE